MSFAGCALVVFGLCGAPLAHAAPGMVDEVGAVSAAKAGRWLAEAKGRAKAGQKKGGKARGKGKGAEGPATPEPAAAEPAASPAVPEPPSGVPANLPAPPPLPTGYKAVAVMPVRGQDVPDDLVRGLEQALMGEVDETEGMRAVSPTDVKNDLAALGFDPAACQAQALCLAKAARYARAHVAFDVKVAALGGALTISMRLIDSDSGAELGRVADPISEDPKERAQEVHRLAVQLLAPTTYVGTLTVQITVEGAEVYVDDRQVGTTPLPGPLDGLRAGPHILKVVKPGFADVNQFVDVVYKRNATVSIDLANNTIGGLIVEVESKTGFGSLWVTANADGIEIRVDGEPRGTTPLSGVISKVAAGKRRLSFRGPKMEPQVQEVEIKADTRADVALSVDGDRIKIAKIKEASPDAPTASHDEMLGLAPGAALAATAPAATAWSPSWRTWTGAAAGGLAVVSLAASSYFGVKVGEHKTNAKSLRDQYEAANGNAPAICSRLNADNTCASGSLADEDSAGKQAQTREFVAMGAGGLLAAAAIGLVIMDLSRAPAPTAKTEVTALDLGLTPDRRGAFLKLLARF
ncbi:MAG: PEGA domain-containing protein [Deltaproteobacteria bacterium]|nr:PEGA domain-containing protein [Deltaproteobacteria bacterium]